MANADSPTKTCTQDGCSNALRARGLCSTHYNQQYQPGRHAAAQTACVVCGTPTARPRSGTRRPVCSVECRTRLTHGDAAGSTSSYNWRADAAQRATKAGATVIEPFDREAIFERDDWTCYLCGLPVDREAPVFGLESATVDHVIPLSRGGEHSMRNARTAHLRCNSAKQDRSLSMTSP